MMNKIEEAIIYATIMHQGKVRKMEENNTPYIMHPLEVANILYTLTKDQDVITAGILHDIVEDTDGTLEEIRARFGERVAFLVSCESEPVYPGETSEDTWQRRKEETLRMLKNTDDIGVKMLWLADKLANIRSFASGYAQVGDELWKYFNQRDAERQLWYYRTIAEHLELSLNKTGAFKELVKHINFIWPGTFDSEKTRFKKYREISVEGCKRIGYGAKGDVYQYNDELVVKVYNKNNTYQDVEREIAQTRKAFILGVPTAISFGIVAVGEKYGAMYELVESETISSCIARYPGQVETYAKMMAELAKTIHAINVTEEDGFPEASRRICDYIEDGIGWEDEDLAEKCRALVNALPASHTLTHGDFHTGNVFLLSGEPILIDMDKVATGHPIVEISDLYYFYVILGEDDPAVVENFMGFPYETARRFFHAFLKYYLETEAEERLDMVERKASLIGYSRLIRKIRQKATQTDADQAAIRRCVEQIKELTEGLDSLTF